MSVQSPGATSHLTAPFARVGSVLALLAVAALLGVGNVVQKPILAAGDPWMAMGIRASIAAIVLLPFAAGEWRTIRLQQTSISPWLLLVVASFAFGMGLQTVGAKYTTATNLGFLINTYVIFMPALVWLTSRVRPNAHAILASVTCFAGACLLSSGSLSAFGPGDLLCLGAALAYAIWVLALSRLGTAATLVATLIFLQWLLVAVLGLAISDATWLDIRAHLQGNAGAYVFLGVFGGAFGFLIAAHAQQRLSACCASVIYAMEGVFGGLAAYAALGEQLGTLALLGAVLILASIIAAARESGNGDGAQA